MDSAALVRPGDWLGWEYSEALPLAEKLGQAPRHVVVSRPPCSGIGEGALRIMTVRPYVDRVKARLWPVLVLSRKLMARRSPVLPNGNSLKGGS